MKLEKKQLPAIETDTEAAGFFRSPFLEKLAADVLPDYLRSSRWFGGKARAIERVVPESLFPLGPVERPIYLVLVRVSYLQGETELYSLPLGLSTRPETEPETLIARIRFGAGGDEGVLFDAAPTQELGLRLFELMADAADLVTEKGRLHAGRHQPLSLEKDEKPRPLGAEQSNTSIRFGRQYILKLYRRIREGVNPDLEIGRLLSRLDFPHIAPVAGYLELRTEDGAPSRTLGLLQVFAENEGDAWEFSVAAARRHLEDGDAGNSLQALRPSPASFLNASPGKKQSKAIGSYFDAAGLLGKRTAELHLALASEREDPDFVPEPFDPASREEMLSSMKGLAGRVFALLREQLKDLPAAVTPLAIRIQEREASIFECFDSLKEETFQSLRIRCHGDYHLGQVLVQSDDFVIIDFEGEVSRPIHERRRKKSPLTDVAGMLRSFQYAAHVSLYERISPKEAATREEMVRSARFWAFWNSARFLQSYLEKARGGGLLPGRAEIETLLRAFLLEKAIYELEYEMNNRPHWLRIPAEGILALLEQQ